MFLPAVPEGVVWAILLLPIASLLIVSLVTKPYPKLSGYVTIAAIGTAFLFALWTLASVIESDGHALAFGSYQWLDISTSNMVLRQLGGPGLSIDVALHIDG